ncbi:MAG: hypothetical protein M1819_001882 [Sarea resinae]|nr:MAG: hypothetical protein M1819_001882 [Sarea resinae]
MDSPIVTHLFRQLFKHRPCPSIRSHSSLPIRIASLASRTQQRRALSNGADATDDTSRRESNWQQRTDIFPLDKSDEFKKYPMVTADQLRSRKERPRRVKMLMRDFIDGMPPLPPPFSTQVVIFSPGEPFDFNAMRDEPEFHRLLGERYTAFEDALDAKSPNVARQLWHTPTELFRPYYGEAIARYLVANYRLSLYPYHDLIIYEMGAGNGTLMLNVLDYIRDFDPSVYARTQYKIIEISSSLAALQQSHLMASASARGHASKVSIINRSIFAWNTYVASPCFFLALEVFDNFAHDAIRYDPFTEEPLQGTVLIDAQGEFYEFYTPQLDPLASRFLRVRDAACATPYPHPLRTPKLLRQLRSRLPFAPNLTDPEYIPTRLMEFFDVLHKHFPAHRLLTSDFHSLPDTIKGINAPVVQTRYQRRTVPVSTPLVLQGHFDILFPTDFSVTESIYRAITGKLTRVLSHEEFLQRWAFVEDTTTRSGENPLLGWYANASVLCTV